MSTISLEPDLMQRVHEAATKKTMLPEELIDTAVRAYLRQLDRERIRTEAEAFQAQHSDLLKNYSGQYVAIYNGQLVDHDSDYALLHSRIRHKYGNQPVLLRRVEQSPIRELLFRSPRMEKA